jgi:hypothetical protein
MTYDGSFVEGELEGYGHALFTSGDTYNGDFVKSKFNGYGSYKYTDGLVVCQEGHFPVDHRLLRQWEVLQVRPERVPRWPRVCWRDELRCPARPR